MSNLKIYCTTIKYFKVMDNLPDFIKPLGLGQTKYPSHWYDEKKFINISHLNKYYAEFTGFYTILKNFINEFDHNDLIGNCHNRVLWLNNFYNKKQKFSTKSLYSELLKKNNPLIYEKDVVQVQPITFKNKNLIEDFREVHKNSSLDDCLNFLTVDLKKDFMKHLNGNELFPHNMFITKKKYFLEYCNVIFPWLNNIMQYCDEKKICYGYNSRIPAFLGERFTSFWFSSFKKRGLLSYARLGNFHLSNKINSVTNTIRLPFTFAQYPSIHKF